jgi:hypothetical protein
MRDKPKVLLETLRGNSASGPNVPSSLSGRPLLVLSDKRGPRHAIAGPNRLIIALSWGDGSDLLETGLSPTDLVEAGERGKPMLTR